VTAGEAMLELVTLWEREAEVVAKYDPEKARIVERLAEQAREVVESHLSPWVPLSAVAERTGYCSRTLRERAQKLRPRGRARKIGGEWHFDRATAASIQPKPNSQPIEPDEWRDMDAAARKLALEG